MSLSHSLTFHLIYLAHRVDITWRCTSRQADEEQVNTLTENDPAAPRLLSLTLRRLSHCVVAVLDRCAESMEVA